MDLKFRNLRKDEIDVRIGSVNKGGASLLLYKDARADMNILDETVGPLNWQRKHEIIDGKLFCTVSIFDPDKNIWVSKQDVGTESYTEKEKGQSSDSFKRASLPHMTKSPDTTICNHPHIPQVITHKRILQFQHKDVARPKNLALYL